MDVVQKLGAELAQGKKNWSRFFFFSCRFFGQSIPRLRLQELTRTATVTVPLPERKGSTRSKNLKGSKTCPRLLTPH